jgi:MMPL family.
MRIDLKNIASVLIDKYIIIFFLIFALTVFSGLGLGNFNLDASSDALVLEIDDSFGPYGEAAGGFGDSSFLIVTCAPYQVLFSDYSIDRIANLVYDFADIDGVDSVFSLLDAPIFFRPGVGFTDVADYFCDITFADIDLDLAPGEIIYIPIYEEFIISQDGLVTAMPVVLKGNNEYNILITKRYSILEKIDSKEVLTSKSRLVLQNVLNDINSRISKINDSESEFNKILINNIRNTLDKYRDDATIYLGGPSMIATDLLAYIESDFTLFGLAVAIIFAQMLSLFFGSIWLVLQRVMNAFLATNITCWFS